MSHLICPYCNGDMVVISKGYTPYITKCSQCQKEVARERYKVEERIEDIIDRETQVKVYIQLSAYKELIPLRKFLPELQKISITDMKKKLEKNNMKWDLGEMSRMGAKNLKREAEERKLLLEYYDI